MTSSPSNKKEYSGRIAVVGLAVHYAGSRDKDEFWDTLNKNETKTSAMSEKRMGTKNKAMHLVNVRPKYADTFNNDRYGCIDHVGDLDNEHDLLLKLAKDALKDMGERNPNADKDLSNYGIVSGCLSFPSERLQGQFLNLYQDHVEAKLPGSMLNGDSSPWNPKQATSSLHEPNDARFLHDPASFCAEQLKLGAVRYSVDAACASALYVLKLAQEHLMHDLTIDAMLCGGVCFPEPLFILTGFSCFHAIPLCGGTSMPLKQHTEGLTPGEGGSVFVLKRYEDAVEAGDVIYGSLLGVHLNNAGQGQPLKPLKESQELCLAQTYVECGVNPHQIQYVECHATGTPLGDVTECDAMRNVFQGRVPRFGSTKGNFGHTLVAAGFAGACKVLLSMQHGSIPPTPGVDANTVVDKLVVHVDKINWPDVEDGRLMRAGLSAFGFGGTNAHAVFEEAKGGLTQPQLPSRKVLKDRIQLIGMAAHFGQVKTLQEFERCLFEGSEAATCELPTKRWRFLSEDENFARIVSGGQSSKPPKGCYIGEFDVDYKRIKTTLVLEDQLCPSQLLALSVIEDALLDSGLPKGGRVAVLVGLGTDLELYRHRARIALKERLNSTCDNATREKLMDYIHDKGTSTSYTSYIGNLVATRISSQWKFTGPSFTVDEGSNSVFRCLQLAEIMLRSGDVEAVVVAGVDLSAGAESVYLHTRKSGLDATPMAAFDSQSEGYYPGEGCGAFILRREDAMNPAKRVYCNVDGIAGGITPQQAMERALQRANVDKHQVDLLELSCDSKTCGEEELESLLNVQLENCAVGTVKANVGNCGHASGAAAMIKTALCLYNRYVPVLPRFSSSEQLVKDSGVYAPLEHSRYWLKDQGDVRVAGVSGWNDTTAAFHVILSESNDHETTNLASHMESKHLLLLTGANASAISGRITSQLVKMNINDLFQLLLKETVEFKPEVAVLSIISTRDKLVDELTRAAKALDSGKSYQSPSGSSFSITPLATSEVAFMYGDGAAPYQGLAKDLWRVFPSLHESTHQLTTNFWAGGEDWNSRPTTALEHQQYKDSFALNQVELFRMGCFMPMMFTHIMRNEFGLEPKAAFGLSLGEISMLFAFSAANSKHSDQLTERLTTSPVWQKEIAGPMNLLREQWQVANGVETSEFWQGCVIRGTRQEVERAIVASGQSHVRITIVNDDKTCLVCGIPTELDLVCAQLPQGSKLLLVSQGMVGHCPEVAVCKPGIEYIHEFLTLPLEAAQGKIQLFSSQTLKPLTSADDLHKVISSVYTNVADFPAIVKAVYAAGIRVFVELGPNSHRTSAVGSILANDTHVAVAFNKQTATSSYDQLLRVLAVLFAQKTPGLKLPHGFINPDLLQVVESNPLIRSIVVNGRFVPNNSSLDLSRKRNVGEAKKSSWFPIKRQLAKTTSPKALVAPVVTVATTSDAMVQGLVLAPVSSPLAGMLLSDSTAPKQVTWHPLLNQAGPKGLLFHPSRFPPRPIQFLPFDASKDVNRVPGQFPFTWWHLSEFMCGNVSNCLGDEFKRFDHSKTSRSPAFDLQVVTRVTECTGLVAKQIYGVDRDPSQGQMVGEFDCPKDAWFFQGMPQDKYMPYSILMEIALQTSGILTSVVKAPLTMNKDDILFRNLDASAESLYVPDLRNVTIVNKTKCTGYSMMGQMGIHRFTFELFEKGKSSPFYRGETSFGWFTPEVFETQTGLDAGVKVDCWHVVEKAKVDLTVNLNTERSKLFTRSQEFLGRRSAQSEFLDEMDLISNSGKFNLGYAHGKKVVVKNDWFFSCHFWNDPVMPGSLGIESMMQCIEALCVKDNVAGKFGIKNPTFNQAPGKTSWKYRGQLTPKNTQMDCEVHIKSITKQQDGSVVVEADGYLFVDRLRVYSATGLRVKIESHAAPPRVALAATTPAAPLAAVPSSALPVDNLPIAQLKNKLLDLKTPVSLAGQLLPSCLPKDLGDASFMQCYGVDFPLYTGAMAKGIASADMVIACGKRRILSSFGAGGLPLHLVVRALDKIQGELRNGEPFMVNLIHSPFNENLEKGCVDLLLERGVHFVEASAFMNVTIHVVRYRVKGLSRGGPNGIVVKNRLVAKISRTELAEMFVRPAPEALLKKLLENGEITPEQAELARQIPLCDDIAVEADSGGHTDNRPLPVILPMIINVRDRVHKEMKYPSVFRVRVGVGGGIGCPQSCIAAFGMGAAFVVTGTINQMSKQSGSSDIVRGQLSKATYSDITMAPAADMFDQGVQLQVLKKGTMFASRAKKLYELFIRYDSLDAIPKEERDKLEAQVFRMKLDVIWHETAKYYVDILKDEAKIQQAERDPKLKMSLVFRWYLGLSSTWANAGVAERAMDYQVWCGPAIGSFNDFIRGSYLDPVVAGGKFPCVAQINMQLFRGACYLKRVGDIRNSPELNSLVDVFDGELASYSPDGEIV